MFFPGEIPQSPSAGGTWAVRLRHPADPTECSGGGGGGGASCVPGVGPRSGGLDANVPLPDNCVGAHVFPRISTSHAVPNQNYETPEMELPEWPLPCDEAFWFIRSILLIQT